MTISEFIKQSETVGGVGKTADNSEMAPHT